MQLLVKNTYETEIGAVNKLKIYLCIHCVLFDILSLVFHRIDSSVAFYSTMTQVAITST